MPGPESRRLVQRLIAESANRPVPEWLSCSKPGMTGAVLRIPTREEIPTVADEKAVVEFYSR